MELAIDIDFNEASKAWRQNKKYSTLNNTFKEYVCGYIKSNGNPCHAPPKVFKKQFREDFVQQWSYCMAHS